MNDVASSKRVSSLVRRISAGTCIQCLAVALALWSNVVVVQTGGLDALGQVSLVMSISSLATIMCTLGWPVLVMRVVSSHPCGEAAQTRAVLATALRQVAIACVVAIAGLWVLSRWSMFVPVRTVLPAVAWLALLRSFATVHRAVLDGHKHVLTTQALTGVVSPVIVSLGLLAIGPAGDRLVTMQAALFSLPLLVLCVMAWRVHSMPGWRDIILPGDGASPVRDVENLQALATGLANALLLNLPGVILNAVVGTAAAGAFALASSVASLVGLGVVAANGVYAPEIAALQRARQPEQARAMFRQVQRLMMVLSAVALLPIGLAPDWWLLLYAGTGVADPAVIDAVRILAVGQFINAATGPVATTMFMVRQTRIVARTMVWTTALALCLCLALTPAYGAVAAAWIVAAATAIANLVQYHHARQRGLA